MYVGDIKLAGKTKNIEPTWKILMEDVDFEEPASFPDHVYLVALKESVKSARILQGNLMQKQYLLGLMTWKVTRRNVWKDPGQWSFVGPGSEKKWYSMEEFSPQGIGDHIAEKMLLEFAESGCPIFRATTPLSRGQLRSKGHGKLSIHFAAVQETIETIFRIIVSAISSVFTEQSRKCVKNTKPFTTDRGDPL